MNMHNEHEHVIEQMNMQFHHSSLVCLIHLLPKLCWPGDNRSLFCLRVSL